MERVRISEYPDYTKTYTVCKNPKLCGAARVFLLLIHGATGVQPSILVGGIDAPTFEITFSSKLVDNLGGGKSWAHICI